MMAPSSVVIDYLLVGQEGLLWRQLQGNPKCFVLRILAKQKRYQPPRKPKADFGPFFFFLATRNAAENTARVLTNNRAA
jgi:hypothetical protein